MKVKYFAVVKKTSEKIKKQPEKEKHSGNHLEKNKNTYENV